MSQREQQQPQRNPPGQASGSTGTTARRNLYLDFPASYQTYYERQNGSHPSSFRGQRKPDQSGFVSSTSWSPGDTTWYKAQTVYATSEISSGPTQDPKVTCSRKESDNHYLKELLNDL